MQRAVLSSVAVLAIECHRLIFYTKKKFKKKKIEKVSLMCFMEEEKKLSGPRSKTHTLFTLL